ncbi:uncharacterized protein N7469_004492 [Penicillium citrinum]|uniref:UDP-glucose:glycoprotein glucosyltransferase n=1 Tax=Penicillium citrinum TaxID=5077 RepID=A0A9W9P4L1_PENCI|nr:uncharacterized protein N7469_004492 [Penicillium citrinum]KAJ5235324.1 hypothetical protein N7469_004492 [Penicillium citrinum]
MMVSSKCHVPWHWFAVIGAFLPGLAVNASPSVNVALQASFDSSPYLVELLESAAEENATAYFPLLDRIAGGAFDDAITEKELYDRFLQVVHEDGHLGTAESLSSFKLSLAIRSPAPRIQAHYQFYNTSVQQSLMAAQDAACPVWVHYDDKQYCSSAMERAQQDVEGEMDPKELPFDRVLGDLSLPPAVLYADVSAPMFKEFHGILSDMAKSGQISYRLRYRPPQHWTSRPLFVSGYGVELALKRTDYIVIDDRDAEQRGEAAEETTDILKEDAPTDLRPLSSSEVSRLGLNAAAYVMDSEDPLETLLKLSQNFPKHSSTVAAHNASKELLQEIRFNRARMIPAGYNVMWINGVQIDSRQIDAFSLLDTLRRERKLIQKFRDLGVSGRDAVRLLSHPALAEARADDEAQRYDYRDETEGGNVIIWLNDLEKDSRYEDWPSDLEAFVSSPYPGQLPPVSRDLHNVVVPLDLSNPDDMLLVFRQIYTFVKRMIPVRFGLVPMAYSSESIAQLKVAHYLHETFGLSSLIKYLEESAASSKGGSPDKTAFASATQDQEPRGEKEALSLDEVLSSERYEAVVTRATKYQRRLSLSSDTPHFLVNGIPTSREGNWMQEMSMLIGRDLKLVQQGIMEGVFPADAWLPEFFLAASLGRRNTFLMPEDPKSVRIIDLGGILGSQMNSIDQFPSIAATDGSRNGIHLIVVGDFETEKGQQLLSNALSVQKENKNIETLLVQNSISDAEPSSPLLERIHQSINKGKDIDQIINIIEDSSEVKDSESTTTGLFAAHRRLAEKLGFEPGVEGLVVNGRAVGPIDKEDGLTTDEIDQLINYERTKRVDAVSKAAMNLGLNMRIAKPLDLAKLSALVSLSTISDVPEGIFESTPDFRLDVSEKWRIGHSVITVSNSDDPAINVVAALDPASENAQRWLPILKVLSELAGVRLKIFLNPKEEMKEIPVKRFYRYVLDSEPSFTSEGSLSRPGASFSGVPVEALLTLGMDVPTSWLVAPKESVHDLDNIKLSSLKTGSNVDAIYALEHILIEGHSRDLTTKTPPRGVQLVLGTENNPHFADTIIMANLGYFQFKAQPGLWQINLKPGRSEKLFNLDSVGGLGYRPQLGDENNEVTLLSFQGRTLFPRLSRKPGFEEEDVLETGLRSGSTMDFVSKGLNFASGVLF